MNVSPPSREAVPAIHAPADVAPLPTASEIPVFTKVDGLLLAAITLAGAALRMTYAWNRPRLGDEVGTLLNIRMDVGYLLTHFSGWLTMNYFIVAEKGVAAITGTDGWPLEILPLLGGIATIPLTASLARRLGGARLGLTAAALTAANPYLLRFSPVIRSYSLLAALAVLAVDLFFRWREQRTWSTGGAAAAVILLLLLAHPNGIYVVIGIGVLVGIECAETMLRATPADARRTYLAGLITFLVPLAVAGAATCLAYHRLAGDVRTFTTKWSLPPPTSMDYIPAMLAAYFGHGFPLFVPAGLFLAGIWSATQTRKTLLPLCLLVILSPVLVSLKGVSHFPWAYARFQIYCVPLMLILVSAGILWLAEQLPRRQHFATLATVALTALTMLVMVPGVQGLFQAKRDDAAFAITADYLRAQCGPGDLVVIEGPDHLAMTPFLPRGAHAPIHAEDFVKKPNNLSAGQRVFFVAPEHPTLGAPEARHRFGKLQVVIYDGPTAAVCASLRADLARVANGRVDPDLVYHYQLLALLDRGRSTPPEAWGVPEWRMLSRLCKTQTARFRSVPEQRRIRNGRMDGDSPPEDPTQAAASMAPPLPTEEETTNN